MSLVNYKVENQIAILSINNPPVNALSYVVRQEILDKLKIFEKDSNVKLLIIHGQGKLFIGGADITEFGKTPKEPILPDVVNRIEQCKKPVLAAIHGMALGGGLEIALACHHRMALAKTKVGLPEVKLGIIPGSGGTQRLPRLVGVEHAIKMITSGNPISATDAESIGLIDMVSHETDIETAAIQYAQEIIKNNLPSRAAKEMATPELTIPELTTDFKKWRDTVNKYYKGQVAPLFAIDAIEASTQLSLADGLKQERSLFLKLMGTPQRSGLMHAFFAERAVTKIPEIENVTPRSFKIIGVIGGGTMGVGISTSALISGLEVILIERDQEALDKAKSMIIKNLKQAIERNKLTEAAFNSIVESKLKTDVAMNVLENADIIIEAVFENIDVKKKVFKELDKFSKPTTILATNTSYLDINEIASVTSKPDNVIGLHFFSPAHIMKLLEVVIADKTSSDVIATAFKFAKILGKTAVGAGVCDGFIGNRILSHYRTAADHMVLDGASPYQIDKAMTDFGFAMGPYQVSDLAGNDIGYATRQRKLKDAHPKDRYPSFADTLYHNGWFGRKTNRGYYIYDEASPKGREDEEVLEIIHQSRNEMGIKAREFTDAEIVNRYMAAMVNEAARVVDENIAKRPLDVDVVFLYGYGFPRWRGGPMKYADLQGLDSILSNIQQYSEEDSHFWQPANLLVELVDQKKSFDSMNNLST